MGVPNGAPSEQVRATWLQRLAVTFYVVCFMSGVWGWFLGVALLFNGFTFLPFLVYLGFTWFGPASKACQDVTWPTPLKKLKVWKYAADFYPAKLVKTADLDPDGNYLFCAHPHGIFCSSLFLTFSTEALGFSKAFPGIDVHFTTLPIHFKCPLVRDWILLHGMLDTRRQTWLKVLTGGSGRSIALAVGGTAEACLVHQGTMDLVVKCRKGFVRIAVQSGASLVPVICFGENELFTTNLVREGSLQHKLQKFLMRTWGITCPDFSWLGPHKVPVNVVVGAAIPVEKFAGDVYTGEGKARTDKVHAQYLAALQKLYDDNKDKYWPNRKRDMLFAK